MLAAIEALLRWRRAEGVPVLARTLYAAALMNADARDHVLQMAMKVQRTGVARFDDWVALWAAAAGTDRGTVLRATGFATPWWSMLPFVSFHRLRYRLQWHVGLRPAPNQVTTQATIDRLGNRATAALSGGVGDPFRVVLLGNSVAFGDGSTSDAASLGDRLQARLTAALGVPCSVENRAFVGATSFQELIDVLQFIRSDNAPDCVVSLSGWCDVDQQFDVGEPNRSGVAQSYSDHQLANATLGGQLTRFVRRHITMLMVINRFLLAYRTWPLGSATSDGSSLNVTRK